MAVAVVAEGRPPHVTPRHVGLAARGAAPVAVAGADLAPGAGAAVDAWLADPARPKAVQDLKLLLHALERPDRPVVGGELDVSHPGDLRRTSGAPPPGPAAARVGWTSRCRGTRHGARPR